MGRESSQLSQDDVLTVVPLEAVRYDTKSGLVPVTVQDVNTREVLMQAYANREALKRTLDTSQAWFWSRSRQDYWHKGATSGNVMDVHEVRLDCDGDSVLYLVSPHGPACHTGSRSCFFQTVTRKGSQTADGPVVETEQGESTFRTSGADSSVSKTLSHMSGGDEGNGETVRASAIERGEASASGSLPSEGPIDTTILTELWQTMVSRYADRPQGSYTTYLFEQGVDKVAKKVGEEAVEVAIAAKNAVSGAGQTELAAESADLLYHLLALWKVAGITPGDVLEVLRSRHQ